MNGSEVFMSWDIEKEIYVDFPKYTVCKNEELNLDVEDSKDVQQSI